MKFFLCDDDLSTHELYATKLAKLCEDHDIKFEFTAYDAGDDMLLDFEKHNGFEGVLFLDINMPNINGISVAKKLQENGAKCEIIFLTVSKQHFLLAFDVGASNYIIKDETTEARFESVVLKAIETSFDRSQEYILFSSAGEYRSIAISSIRYFEVTKRIITVHYNSDDTFEFFSSLGKVENELLGQGFVRAHRAFLVYVPCIETLTYSELKMRDGTAIPVGRKYYQDIKNALNAFLSL